MKSSLRLELLSVCNIFIKKMSGCTEGSRHLITIAKTSSGSIFEKFPINSVNSFELSLKICRRIGDNLFDVLDRP